MSVKLVLPPPPKTYDPYYEMLRNREIERVMNTKIGVNDINIFGGQPFISLRGTDTAFTIPTGITPRVLPFNLLQKDTDKDMVFDPNSYSITNPYAMDAVVYLNLRHAAAPGGDYDLNIQGYDLGSPFGPPLTVTIKNTETLDVRITRFVVGFPPGTVFDLRAWHTRAGPVSFNIALSQWDIARVSPNPALVIP